MPASRALITNDAVPLRAAQADADERPALVEAGACVGPERVILGGLLASQHDGQLDPTPGFLPRTAITTAAAYCAGTPRSWR